MYRRYLIVVAVVAGCGSDPEPGIDAPTPPAAPANVVASDGASRGTA